MLGYKHVIGTGAFGSLVCRRQLFFFFFFFFFKSLWLWLVELIRLSCLLALVSSYDKVKG